MSSIREGVCVIAAMTLMTAAGCQKKTAVAPPEPRGLPPLEGAAAAPTAVPTAPVAAMPANHPPIARGATADAKALPKGHPPIGTGGVAEAPMPGNPHAAASPFQGATPGGDFDARTVLAGVIKIDPKLKDKIAPGDVVFVVARKYEANGATGIPLAVKRLTADKFPLPFSLDSRDAMLAGTQLAGKVVVTARVDKDGDAITKTPGDLTGTSKPLVPPQKEVVVALDTVL